MSSIKINNITNESGTSGPVISGISTVNSSGFMRVPSGDTRTRIVLPNENIVTDGLVLYLDAGKEASFGGDGTTWRDLSGENNNGTLENGVGYTVDDGGSLIFDGVNDYVNCGNSLTQLTTEGTISTWCYLTDVSTDERLLVGKLDSGNPLSYGLYFNYYGISSNSISFFVDSDGSWGPSSLVNSYNILPNTWYNFVGIWNNTGTFIYTNGTLSDSNSNIISAAVNTSSVRIGGGASGWTYWKGNIPQVSIYNRALTASEVLQNYNATKYRYEN